MGVDVDMASRLFGDPVALRKYQRTKDPRRTSGKNDNRHGPVQSNPRRVVYLASSVINFFMEFVKILGKAYIPHIIMSIYAIKALGAAF